MPTGSSGPAAMFHADYAHFHEVTQTSFSGFFAVDLFGPDFFTPAPNNPAVIEALSGSLAPGGTSTASNLTLHEIQHSGINDNFEVAFSPNFTGEAVALKEGLTNTTVTHPEGNDFVFTALRTGGQSELERPLDVDWQVTGSGAHPADTSDFVGGVLPHGTVHFPANDTLSAVPGALSQTITIPVLSDADAEGDETFTVTLTPVNPTGINVVTASASATGLIQEVPVTSGHVLLSLSPTDITQPEGNSGTTGFTFTVLRGGDANAINGGTTNVDFAVTGTGANPADVSDFAGGTFPSGTVTFAAGETSKTITIPVLGDTDREPDETFTLALSNASGGATIVTGSARGTIQDTPPPADHHEEGNNDHHGHDHEHEHHEHHEHEHHEHHQEHCDHALV